MSRFFIGLLLVCGLASCGGDIGFGSLGVSDAQGLTGGGVLVRGKDDAARWRKALDLVPARSPHSEILRRLGKAKSTVFVDDRDRVRGLPAGLEVKELFEGGVPDEVWFDRSERAVAEALLARGGGNLLIRRDIAPSLDRNQGVLNRLYNDDHHPWFKLLAVDKYFLLYRVNEQPLKFTPAMAFLVARQIRSVLKGEPIAKIEGLKSEDGKKWNLIATARREGGLALSVGMCLRNTLQECILELARDLEREHRRGPEIQGFRPIS
jgi:hypothetical protein